MSKCLQQRTCISADTRWRAPSGVGRAGIARESLRLRNSAKFIKPTLCAAVSESVEEKLQQVDAVVEPRLKVADGWQTLVGLSAVAGLVCAIDRAAISVAILPMSHEFGWDESTKGLISSVFLFGYMMTNLFGGYMATRYRPKRVLGTGVVVWSMFTVATPFAAASGNLPLLLMCRMLMGMGEGVCFPSVQQLVSSNVPSTTKATALTVIYSGAQAGTIVSLMSAPAIIDAFSWPAVFYVFGSLGFIWLMFWVPLVRDNSYADVPSSSRPSALYRQWLEKRFRTSGSAQVTDSVQRQEQPFRQVTGTVLVDRSTSQADVPRSADDSAVTQGEPSTSAAPFNLRRHFPWRALASNRPFWAIFWAHSAFGFGHYLCGAWLPTYYFQEYGLDVRQSAWLSALPYLVTILVMTSGGWLSDALVNGGRISRVNIRKILQILSGVGPAACLLYLAAASNHSVPNLSLGSAVGLMTVMLAMGGFSGAGFGSNHQDLTQRYSGILFGITSASSSACGCLSTYATGVLLDLTHSWAIVFEVVALVYIASSAVYVAWASSDNQFDNLLPQTAAAKKD